MDFSSTDRDSSPLFVIQDPKMAADPTEQVAELVRQYEARSNVSRTLSMLFRDQAQKELFLDVFTHHIDLLKSRSQAFEDAHVTVYDKALLTLTRYGNDNPGAFELYLDEIIGVPQHGRLASMESVLEKNVALKELLFKGTVCPPPCESFRSTPSMEENKSSPRPFHFSSLPHMLHPAILSSEAERFFLARIPSTADPASSRRDLIISSAARQANPSHRCA